jgi:enamine deaminase RidA (YjgF/YER057c/UK114 family)
MTIERSNPPELSPPPTGVYSHLVAATGKLLFIAGQLPRDEAGKLVGHNDIAAQYRQAWRNILTALRAAGSVPSTWSKPPCSLLAKAACLASVRCGKSFCFRTRRPPRW